jgi:hypothetical protein
MRAREEAGDGGTGALAGKGLLPLVLLFTSSVDGIGAGLLVVGVPTAGDLVAGDFVAGLLAAGVFIAGVLGSTGDVDRGDTS